MAIAVMILGASGSGKSASMRNFKGSELGVINVADKPLPFKSDIKTYNSDRYEVIEQVLKKAKTKSIVIDDSQYLMANEFMRRSGEIGYQKFTDIAKNFWSLIDMINRDLPEDVIVYFMHHTEVDVNGNEKAKTVGKMLDEKITIEGLFTIVLKAEVNDGRYLFATKTNGSDAVKTPMGMFEDRWIDNDLKMVDTTIREFYGLGKESK